MSHTSSPAISASRFSSPGLSTTSASPAPYLTGTPSPVTNGTSAKAKAKAVNVFTNDGSFLQRFQRSKKEEEDKDKQDEIMNRLIFPMVMSLLCDLITHRLAPHTGKRISRIDLKTGASAHAPTLLTKQAASVPQECRPFLPSMATPIPTRQPRRPNLQQRRRRRI